MSDLKLHIIDSVDTSIDDKIYCGVDGSICDKGLRINNHSLCCLKCKHRCSNCTVKDINECDLFCSKKEIIASEINELLERKYKLLKEVCAIDNKIEILEKELNI